MTELLAKALDQVKKLSPERQNEIAAILLDLVSYDFSDVELSPEQEAGLEEAIKQADRGEFARPEDIDALFAKYGA